MPRANKQTHDRAIARIQKQIEKVGREIRTVAATGKRAEKSYRTLSKRANQLRRKWVNASYRKQRLVAIQKAHKKRLAVVVKTKGSNKSGAFDPRCEYEMEVHGTKFPRVEGTVFKHRWVEQYSIFVNGRTINGFTSLQDARYYIKNGKRAPKRVAAKSVDIGKLNIVLRNAGYRVVPTS